MFWLASHLHLDYLGKAWVWHFLLRRLQRQGTRVRKRDGPLAARELLPESSLLYGSFRPVIWLLLPRVCRLGDPLLFFRSNKPCKGFAYQGRRTDQLYGAGSTVLVSHTFPSGYQGNKFHVFWLQNWQVKSIFACSQDTFFKGREWISVTEEESAREIYVVSRIPNVTTSGSLLVAFREMSS